MKNFEFYMNNRKWTIKEVPQEEVIEKIKTINEEPISSGVYFGITVESSQEILIDKDLHLNTRRATLFHELMHCYIRCYGVVIESYSEEQVCDMFANAYIEISKIYDDYVLYKASVEG